MLHAGAQHGVDIPIFGSLVAVVLRSVNGRKRWTKGGLVGKGGEVRDGHGRVSDIHPITSGFRHGEGNFPSMPIYFWSDSDGAKYRAAYFDRFPGVWCHGDYMELTDRGTCIIYGRSDATLNPGGVRIGTAEIYRVVEDLPEVLDSLVVDLEYLGRDSYMPLFVVLREGMQLDDALRSKLVNAIKTALLPRFVPNEIFQVASVSAQLSAQRSRKLRLATSVALEPGESESPRRRRPAGYE